MHSVSGERRCIPALAGATFGSGRNSAKFWRLSAQTVLEVARLVCFLCLWRGISAKWGINRPKTPQNHSRQHRKTKVSELYLSDCLQAILGMKFYDLRNL